MATGGSSDRGENDVVELEAMRKDTFSWHPCQVSLCCSALGLLVQYGDNNLEEIISDKDGVFALVRVRSTPLQGDDCSSLQEGDHVLATRNSQVKGLFCDANVEEAFRVRHSKRTHCRCSFKIKWLHQAVEEKPLTVPASAIKKLSTKSVLLHPTISTFFSMLESSNGLKTSPFEWSLDNMKLEVDISVLLEKQIEDITKASDVPEKKISKNLAFGLGGDLKELNHATAIDASLKDPCVTVTSFNNLWASIGTNNKQSPEITVSDSLDPVGPNQGQFTGSRSPLNPLAAHAALALLRSNFPLSAEHSVPSNVEEGDITKYVVDFSSNTDDISLKISANSGGRSRKFESIVKTLFPTSSSPPEAELSNVPSGVQRNGSGRKRKNQGNPAAQPSERRVTRLQVQRNNGTQESMQMTNVKEKQLEPSPKTRRVARSMFSGELNAAAEENTETKFVQFQTSSQNAVPHPQCSLSDTQESDDLSIDGVHHIHPVQNGKNLLGKDRLIAKADSRKKGFAVEHNCSRRITRSAALEEVMKNLKPNLKSGREKGISESIKMDILKRTGPPEKPVARGSKTTQNAGNGGTAAADPKQEIRASPRLRSLRSHSKG